MKGIHWCFKMKGKHWYSDNIKQVWTNISRQKEICLLICSPDDEVDKFVCDEAAIDVHGRGSGGQVMTFDPWSALELPAPRNIVPLLPHEPISPRGVVALPFALSASRKWLLGIRSRVHQWHVVYLRIRVAAAAPVALWTVISWEIWRRRWQSSSSSEGERN